MATIRKRQKKSEEKKEVVLEEVKKEEFPTALSPEDLKTIEIMSRDVDNARLLMSVEEQYLANLNLKLDLLKNAIEKQKSIVLQKSEYYEKVKNKYTGVKKEMFPRYGIKETDSLSYNSNTGEIVK